jgi:thioredoxin-like negative regulator of GroEL
MAMLGSRSYDRARLLQQATRALRRRRRGKALTLYCRVLENEPKNPDLHRRVAPLLAASGRVEDALASYRIAAGSLARKGFLEHAVGVYREAAQQLPRQRVVWEALADLELQRGKPADAHRALVEGARHLRGRRLRSDAVTLLLRARKLEPRHVDTGFALARALVKVGGRRQAASLLANMATWTRGRDRRRVRIRHFVLAPGLGTAWRCVTACFGRTAR